MSSIRSLCVALAFLVLCAAPLRAAEREHPVLLVLAAASLTDVLGALAAQWEMRGGGPVKLSFAASSVLARQIEAGGRADVFISADREWMDYLATRVRLVAGSRRDLAGNRLVLIAPADSRVELELRPGFPLARALGAGRLATADPDTVPAGRYARAALRSLGVWDDVATRLVPAENVRGALMFVARGEVALGIVYATDARADARVRVVGTFPANSHEPIAYPAAALGPAHPDAAGFLDFLESDAARATWHRFGFDDIEG